MEKFVKAAEDMIKFNKATHKYYEALKKINSGLFDGVNWIWFVLAVIATLLYNGWKWLGNTIAQAGGPNPKINTVLFVVVAVTFVIALIEKIGQFKEKSNAKMVIRSTEQKREELMRACDEAAEECAVEMYPWWRNFDAFNRQIKPYVDFNLAYFPKEIILSDENGEYVAEWFSGEVPVYGNELLAKMKYGDTGKTYYFFSQKPEPFKTYYSATLARVRIESAEGFVREWVSDENMDENVREYENYLDDEERSHNFSEYGTHKTNEELNKDYIHRAYDEEKRRKQVEMFKALCGHWEEKSYNEGQWYHTIETQATIYMDTENGNIIGLCMDEGSTGSKHYALKTTAMRPGKNCRVVSKGVYGGRCPEYRYADVERVLRNISDFHLGEIDFSIQKPANIPDDYWGLWLNAHYNITSTDKNN